MGKKPIKEGLWATNEADGRTQLLASQCLSCGEIFFPRKDNNLCTYCQSDELKDILLSNTGEVFSYTVVMQRPPEYYKGDVPYAFGYVELPEGVRVEGLLISENYDEIKVGSKAEMVLDTLHCDEEGNEVITYKYKISA
jgi:uncharacterized OB-fold protein